MFSLNREGISKEEAVIALLKKGIWLYFLLLIFEGALRKWVLPFLSTPLLIVRDPVAIGLIFMAWKYNIVKGSFYVYILTFLTLFSVCTALLLGHGSITVAIFGARILLFHFPVMFIMGKVLSLEDVIQIGRVLLIITIPMAILIALQFYSPQSAWVNRGVGGDMEGGGFSGAMGYFRPPGTFSFTTGNVMYFNFAACYVFYFWLTGIKINKLILIGATVGVLVSIPLSISRTLLFSIGITLFFAIIAVSSKPKFLWRILLFLFFGFMLLLLLSNTEFFRTGTAAFTERFEVANKVEGGVSTSIFDRFFGGMFTAISESHNLPLFGHGIGMGTNAGAALLSDTGEATTFLIAEGEWSRLVGEMGFIVGVLVLLVRVVFCIQISAQSYLSIGRDNLLPWLLLSFGILVILQGQWAQPTVLGFSTLLGGLILAASKKSYTLKTSNSQ